jgi:hypothetical protein
VARFLFILRACLLALLVATPARELRAEARAGSPLVAYRAPASCRSASAFSEQVAARTRLWQSAELAVQIELQATADGFSGRVSLERQGTRTEREISGTSCDEVVRALALIVAILIDPSADTRPLPAGAQPPEVMTGRREPLPALPEPTERTERNWFVYAGTEALLEGGLAPGLTPGLRIFAGVLHRSPAAVVSSLRLSALRLQSGSVPAGGVASAAFALTGVRLEICSFGVGSPALRLNPCLFGELGGLLAEGTHPAGSNSESQLWSALGPALRGSLWHREILFVELEAGAVFPVTDYRFAFKDEPPVYETPVIAGEFGVALGVRFP